MGEVLTYLSGLGLRNAVRSCMICRVLHACCCCTDVVSSRVSPTIPFSSLSFFLP